MVLCQTDSSATTLNGSEVQGLEEPPAYEAPPEYEEVLSLYAESERCDSRASTQRRESVVGKPSFQSKYNIFNHSNYREAHY